MSYKRCCPECGEPLRKLHSTLHTSGQCGNRECGKFGLWQTRTENLFEFLDLSPYTKPQFLDLPNDTPIWIEYRSNMTKVCCVVDILLGVYDGIATFALSDALPVSLYNKKWRAWPTYKTARPDQLEIEDYPWPVYRLL